jgi:hypothetical protein
MRDGGGVDVELERELTEELEALAATLDLPGELAEEAVLRYEAVAAWLGEDGSPLAKYSPEIYPQHFQGGSAGTQFRATPGVKGPKQPSLDGERFGVAFALSQQYLATTFWRMPGGDKAVRLYEVCMR